METIDDIPVAAWMLMAMRANQHLLLVDPQVPTFTGHRLKFIEAYYQHTPNPSREERAGLAFVLGSNYVHVTLWFCHRRAHDGV
jgi:Homeobox domain.